ncbi:MAG: DUF4145 domain-containing protein [Candidatus Acidiferrales bacterium]
MELITSSASLLDRVIPPGSAHSDLPRDIRRLVCGPRSAQYVLATLKAINSDFDRGMFEHLSVMVEAEATADYLGQANKLMLEGTTGNLDHIPTAVLAGAVLERALRVFCGRQSPPIDIKKANGDTKTLNPLIDDLKKSGLFNELKAIQLRAWAAIRNQTAHGEFDRVKRNDVAIMLTGICDPLADYM